MPNRLINETSPYLLQHANNPVEWYPWGEEALERARSEDKPILLSIGYSACHWCHVMERESFEDETIAGLMNDNFISIKIVTTHGSVKLISIRMTKIYSGENYVANFQLFFLIGLHRAVQCMGAIPNRTGLHSVCASWTLVKLLPITASTIELKSTLGTKLKFSSHLKRRILITHPETIYLAHAPLLATRLLPTTRRDSTSVPRMETRQAE